MKPEAKARSTWIFAFQVMALAAPALIILVLISTYGVNVPFWDQWDCVPRLIEKMNKGTLGFGDFFAQHSEHRIFFPRLVMFSLALLTHWNIKVELFTSWVLVCICAYNLWRLQHVTGCNGSAAGFWLLFAANILLFTPLQSQNFLWGFQIGFFLPLAVFTSLLWIIPSSRTEIAFLAAIALSIIATFSIAGGFVSWLLALFLLLFPNGRFNCQGRKGWLILFFLIFVSSQILYLWNYQKPTYHPSLLTAMRYPRQAIAYIFAYCGSTFAWGTAFSPKYVAVSVGAILLILFCACLFYLFLCRDDCILVGRSLPWVTLCLFAISNDVVTAIGRAGFGTDHALVSRYVTFSVMMPIGLLFLMRLLFVHRREQTISQKYVMSVSMGLSILISTLAVLLMLSSLASLRVWAQTRHDRLCDKAVVQLINVIGDSNAFRRYVYPDPVYVPDLNGIIVRHVQVCKEMGRLGYLRPDLVVTNLIREIAKPTSPGESTSGFFDQITKSADGHFTVSGWSVLPERKDAAVATLLTYDDDYGQARIFGIAFQNVARPDVASALNTKSYVESGWSSTLDTTKLPPGQRSIRAWAFDPESCRAYELNGTKVISVTL